MLIVRIQIIKFILFTFYKKRITFSGITIYFINNISTLK